MFCGVCYFWFQHYCVQGFDCRSAYISSDYFLSEVAWCRHSLLAYIALFSKGKGRGKGLYQDICGIDVGILRLSAYFPCGNSAYHPYGLFGAVGNIAYLHYDNCCYSAERAYYMAKSRWRYYKFCRYHISDCEPYFGRGGG